MRSWLALALLLSGCTTTASLSSGSFDLSSARIDDATVEGSASLDLDLDAMTVAVLDADGNELVTADLVTNEATPTGCPTMRSSTAMEVLSLDVATLVIPLGDATVTLDEPVLIASCPDGDAIVLQSGAVSLDTLCAEGPCLTFE